MSLSQQDLNVRLQKIGCCTGEQAKLAARYYLYGSECAEEQLQKLTLLNAYLDILSCYKVQSTTDTNWIYQIDLTSIMNFTFTQDDTFNLYINGELIANYVIAGEGVDFCTYLTNITSTILSNENVIDATSFCNETNATINVTVNCNMTTAYFTYSNNFQYAKEPTVIYLPIYIAQQGKCITGDTDNCVTEKQIEVILENIAIMCKDCFKPNGFAYYNNTINLNSNIAPDIKHDNNTSGDGINIAFK